MIKYFVSQCEGIDEALNELKYDDVTFFDSLKEAKEEKEELEEILREDEDEGVDEESYKAYIFKLTLESVE